MNKKKQSYVRDMIRFVTLSLLMASLFSCHASNDIYVDHESAYGTVVEDNSNEWILLDDEITMLKIVSYAIEPFNLEVGNRVYIIYTIVEEKNDPHPSALPVYSVIIHDIKKILVKNYLIGTEITEEEEAELGIDKIDISNAWISAGYLNINFYLYTANLPTNHFVNLVLDNANSTDEKKYLTFRHNAFTDNGTLQRFGRVSFNLKDIIGNMVSGSKIEFVLQWTSYQSEENRESIIYTKK